jgi:hypothetical protein
MNLSSVELMRTRWVFEAELAKAWGEKKIELLFRKNFIESVHPQPDVIFQ